MNREQRIVSAALQNRGAFYQVSPLVTEGVFSRHIQLVWDMIDAFYELDEQAMSIDKQVLLDKIVLKHPKHESHFSHLLAEIDEVSVPNTVEEWLDLRRASIESRLAEAIMAGDGKDVINELIEERDLCEAQKETEDDSTLIGMSLEKVLKIVAPENIIHISPESLALRLDGGLLRGTQSVIYAPTEVGKSLLSIEITCGLLRDGRKVVYGGNEDPARSMLMRIYSNLSGMTKKEMQENPQDAEYSAMMQGYENLVFLDLSPGTLSDFRRAIERHSPDVVIVDQMANLDAGKVMSKVEKNEYFATQFRSMAKKYDIATIMVHQASDDAYGKRILEKNHLYYSNVGVQGQMDVMIGIGMSADDERENKRMICLTKNKISADHSCFPITVDPLTSSVVE